MDIIWKKKYDTDSKTSLSRLETHGGDTIRDTRMRKI